MLASANIFALHEKRIRKKNSIAANKRIVLFKHDDTSKQGHTKTPSRRCKICVVSLKHEHQQNNRTRDKQEESRNLEQHTDKRETFQACVCVCACVQALNLRRQRELLIEFAKLEVPSGEDCVKKNFRLKNIQ